MAKRYSVKSALRLLALVCLSLLLIEGINQVISRYFWGYWPALSPDCLDNDIFVAHPFLAVAPKPNIRIEINGKLVTHNSYPTRGAEFSKKKRRGITRIVTLGGSTTYGTGVSDNETWPFLLQKALGNNFEVINLGVPGYSTAENLIQTAFWFSELEPDLAIYYEGWNDAHVSHIDNLSPGYSDFHARQQYRSLCLTVPDPDEKIATLFLLEKGFYHWFIPDPVDDFTIRPDADAYTSRVDFHALKLYRRNLTLIATLCRKQHVRALFAPQILNVPLFKGDGVYGWLPYVRDKDVPGLIAHYNKTMSEVAKAEHMMFVKSLRPIAFESGDFIDNGHFSPVGDQKMVSFILPDVKAALTKRQW